MSKLSIKGILEKLNQLNKLNPFRYMISGSKNKRNFAVFRRHAMVLSKGVEEALLQKHFIAFHGNGCQMLHQ